MQGAWVDEECVRKVVAHWRRQVTEIDVRRRRPGRRRAAPAVRGRVDDDDSDDLLAEAMELVVRAGIGSTSMLQRKLRVGFAGRAGSWTCSNGEGVVGPSEGIEGALGAHDRRRAREHFRIRRLTVDRGATGGPASTMGTMARVAKPDTDRAEPRFYVETLGCPKNAVDSDKVIAAC